ncbi:MAG: P1 family peptidase, partial [Acidimicrobiia bacterium]
GSVLAGSTAPAGSQPFPPVPETVAPLEHTTLVALVTNARCTKGECRLLAESAHHGMVRSIHPSHTRHDGDVAFAVSTCEVDDVQIDRLRVLATEVTADAVRSAVSVVATETA